VRISLTGTTRVLVGKWLDHHHDVQRNEGGKGGDEVHVFAVEHGAVFGGAETLKTYEVVFQIGPVKIRVIRETS
jgi:hypothetical protein